MNTASSSVAAECNTRGLLQGRTKNWCQICRGMSSPIGSGTPPYPPSQRPAQVAVGMHSSAAKGLFMPTGYSLMGMWRLIVEGAHNG